MRSGFTIIEVLVALLAASIIALMSFEYLSNVVNLETKVKIKISKDRDELNTVFTLCKEEVCPVLNSKAQILSIPFDDPASDRFSSNQLDKFREVRDSIFDKLKELKNLFEN